MTISRQLFGNLEDFRAKVLARCAEKTIFRTLFGSLKDPQVKYCVRE